MSVESDAVSDLRVWAISEDPILPQLSRSFFPVPLCPVQILVTHEGREVRIYPVALWQKVTEVFTPGICFTWVAKMKSNCVQPSTLRASQRVGTRPRPWAVTPFYLSWSVNWLVSEGRKEWEGRKRSKKKEVRRVEMLGGCDLSIVLIPFQTKRFPLKPEIAGLFTQVSGRQRVHDSQPPGLKPFGSRVRTLTQMSWWRPFLGRREYPG